MPARRANFLLGLSAATLIAAVLGVQLGRSAIAEIDPIHFRGAAPAPRAIDPDALRPAPNAYAMAYGWDQGHAARAAECGGDCDARQAGDAMVFALEAPGRAQRAGGPWWRDATAVTEPAPWRPGETGGRQLSVEPYMHYPIEADPAAEPAADQALPADEGDGALVSD